MKKRITATILVICLSVVITPVVSRAAVIPYFMAVNDTLLPFSDENMPDIIGGEIFVPPGMFAGVSVWSVASENSEQIRLYRGVSKHVDFYTARGITVDQDDNVLSWPSARKIGNKFYVPLRQVCEYFGLTYEIYDISREVIPQEQMRVIRIRSVEGFNKNTFLGLNGNAFRKAYNEYYAPAPSTPPATESPGEASPLPPVVEPPPTYSDVTIYLSFYDVAAGGAGRLLDLLATNAASGGQACFFVSADDIKNNPGLIRRISGGGYTIGIWLKEGTVKEYLETSSLLFEAAKIKTIIIAADEMTEDEKASAEAYGLIIWESSHCLVYNDTLSVANVTDMIPTEGGARQNLMSACSEDAALMLSGILLYLHVNEYNIAKITETVAPVK